MNGVYQWYGLILIEGFKRIIDWNNFSFELGKREFFEGIEIVFN